MKLPEGLNIEVTDSQYEMLYDVIMMAYELDVPEQKGWDMQTYDNLAVSYTHLTLPTKRIV